MNPFILNTKAQALIISPFLDLKAKKILEKDFTLIEIEVNKNLDPRIGHHPDVNVHPIDARTLVIDKSIYKTMKEKLKDYELDIYSSEFSLGKKYPRDSHLNIGRLDNYYIHYGCSDTKAEKLLEARGLKKIEVKQGYAKCSTLVTPCGIITSDMGIHKSLVRYKLHSQLIPSGDILLKGYDTGFIGGCGGMVDENTLFLTGDMDLFAYNKELIKGLDPRIELIYPKGLPLEDTGGIIPII